LPKGKVAPAQEDGMTISAIGASGVHSPYQFGAAQQPGLRQQMSALFKDIQSGNLTAARSDYSALAQLLGGPGGASASSSPFSALLGQIGSALSAGDITAAQSALSQVQTGSVSQAASQAQAVAASTPHHHHHRHGSATQDGVASLIQAIQGGDLDSAQQAYDSLTDGDDGTLSGAADPAKKKAAGDNVFSQLVASVGQSLANNDIAGAQKDLASFAQTHKVGSAVSVTA
jgi:hypothetical protein